MPAPLVLPTEESVSESPAASRPVSARTVTTEAGDPEEALEDTQPNEDAPLEEFTEENEEAPEENMEDDAEEQNEEEAMDDDME